MTDMIPRAEVLPDVPYFAVWSVTGVHIGVWRDGKIAADVLSEYPGGTMMELVPRAQADALVAAAYKVVAKAMGDYHWNRYRTKDEGGELSYPAVFTSHTGQKAKEICLSLTPEHADAALKTMLAEARREERARALDEVSEQWAAALYGMTENGVAALNEKAASELHPEITAFSEWLTDAAIRAEAE